MKRKFFYALYAVALALLPLLLILVTRLESPSELLRPPGLSGEQREIQEAFLASVGDKQGVVYQYPTGGEYRSAFVLHDLDGDDDDEALVYYTLKNDDVTIRVNVLDKLDDGWVSVFDEPGYGSRVLSVEFSDLNLDGSTEIITCWSLFESSAAKTLTVHSTVSDNEFELDTLVNQSYTFNTITDIDSDGFNEILVVWLDDTDSNLPKSYASLLKQDADGNISLIGDNVALDASVSAYSSLVLERDEEGRAVAFLDAYKGEDSMITEVIRWDEETHSLVAPFLDRDTLTNVITLRTPAIPSMDFDGDNMIEIPIVVNTGGTAVESENALRLYAWAVPDGNTLIPENYGFINTANRFFLSVPEGLKDYLLAYRLSDDSYATVYYTEDGESRGDPLFTLLIKKATDITDEDKYTFKVVHEGMVIYGTLTAFGEEMGFTNEYIEGSFTFY